MDIWQWVSDTYHQLQQDDNSELAAFMTNISTLACNDDHDKLDAMVPQALALAKKHPNPWIELFLRHWNLQSKVLRRHYGEQMLPEAIDLLHFANQDNTKDCPQSICVVQDLANCYGKTDGPGFSEERIAVSTETLGRINPQWPCYRCIGSEYCHALADSGDYQGALDALEEMEQQMMQVDPNRRIHSPMNLSKAEFHLRLNHLEKAEQLARSADTPGGGKHFERLKQLDIARILAFRGKYHQALEQLPPFSEVLLAQSFSMPWCETTYQIAINEPEFNSNQLNKNYNHIVDKLSDTGCVRDAISASDWQTQLAFARQDLFTVSHCIERIKHNIPKLNKDLGATEILQRIEQEYQRQLNQLNQQAQQVLHYFNRATDELEVANFSLSQYQLAYQQLNDNQSLSPAAKIKLCCHYAQNLNENGYIQPALAIIADLQQQYLTLEPSNADIIYSCCSILLEQDEKQFDQFCLQLEQQPLLQDAQLQLARWQYIRHQRNHSQAIVWLDKILSLDDQDIRALKQKAHHHYCQDDYQAAIDCYQQLLTLDPSNSDLYWDMLLPATMDKQWRLVRHCCQQLSIDIEQSDQPIDDAWEMLLIEMPAIDSDNTIELKARRTGPVTAKIIGFQSLEQPQFVGQIICFDPAPLNELKQTDEHGNQLEYPADEQGREYLLYPYSKTIDATTYRVTSIDGVFPGEEKWQQLREQLFELDCYISWRSDYDYVLFKHQQPQKLDAFYLYLGIPPNIELNQVHQVLQKFSDNLEHPLVWPQLAAMLAQQTGDMNILQQQAQIEETYGIEAE